MNRVRKSPTGWKQATLEDLVFFQRGYDITKDEQESGDIPVVSSSGVNSFHAEAKVDGPGVVIGRKGSLGTVHYVQGPYWPHDTTLWSKDLKGNNPRFVYYFLHTLGLERYDVGNSNPTLNRNHIHGLDIAIPKLVIQQRISDILSAYDDLIENNRRRIQLLEQAARLLYKEWFVHLRFPGHEHVTITNGVPEGWEKKPLPEIANFRLGKMLDQKKNRGDLMPYLANVNVRWGEFDFDNLREMRFEPHEVEKYGLRYGDIVMCEGGEPGRCAIWKEQIPGMMIQKAIHRIRPHEDVDYRFLYHSLYHKGKSGHLSALFTGATIKHLPREKLAKVEIEIPSPKVMSLFLEHVDPIEKQIGVLQTGIRRASEARDLLLPRLMNGELTV